MLNVKDYYRNKDIDGRGRGVGGLYRIASSGIIFFLGWTSVEITFNLI